MTDERDLLLKGIVHLELRVEDASGHTISERTERIDCNNFPLTEVGTKVQRDAYDLLRQIVEEIRARKGAS